MPGVLLLCFQYFCWSFGVYGLVLWIPEMIRSGSTRGIEQVGMLSAAPFLLAVVLMLAVAMVLRSLAESQIIRVAVPHALGRGAVLLVRHRRQPLLARLRFFDCGGRRHVCAHGPFFAIVPEMLPATVAGEVMALVNSFGALGGFAGTWLVGWLQALTGNSRAGFLSMSMALIVAGAITLCLPSTRRSPHPA